MRRTDDDAARLQELLARRSQTWIDGGVQERIEADIALHRAIVTATHNELLAELYEGLVPLFAVVLHDDVAQDSDPHADEHARLVEAIVAHDAAGARGQVDRMLDPLIADAE